MGLSDFCWKEKKLAQVYILKQKINKVYDLEKGLYFGTIFPELNMPCKFDFVIKNKK